MENEKMMGLKTPENKLIYTAPENEIDFDAFAKNQPENKWVEIKNEIEHPILNENGEPKYLINSDGKATKI